MTFGRTKAALVSVAALYRESGELDRRSILFDGVGQGLVLDVVQRAQPILHELRACDPDLFARVPVRDEVSFSPAASRDILRLIRRDLLFALETAVNLGLFERTQFEALRVVSEPLPVARATEGSAKKILVGVAIAVLSAALLFAFGLKK